MNVRPASLHSALFGRRLLAIAVLMVAGFLSTGCAHSYQSRYTTSELTWDDEHEQLPWPTGG